MRTVLIALSAFLLGIGAVLGFAAWRSSQRPHPVAGHGPAALHPAPAQPAAPPQPPANRKPLLATESPPSLLPDKGWPANAPTPEQVLYDQPRLLDRELSQLKARTPGRPNLYALVFAGDGSENVFRNEAEYFGRLFAQRFDAAGHVVVLENNPSALTDRPLADWSNLETALDAIAAKMDLRQDILLLYFTTHGSEDHTLLVDMDPLPLDQIGAQDMAGILREHPFGYKVVVVNACYSGGFIPPLHGEGTLVITAARSDRSSFGCGEQSQLTWFGHAFLVDALNRTADFGQAFSDARAEVAAWEKHDGYVPSEPQVDAGAGIRALLAAWRRGFVPGAAVPFTPASAPRRSTAVRHP